MFKKFTRYPPSSQYGASILLIILMIGSFYIGAWWTNQDRQDSLNRQPPLTEAEKAWQQQGLLIGDGLYFIDSEIKPSIYRTTGADTSLYGCRWQRLSGFGAENDNIIVNYYDNKGLPTIVELAPTDAGFKTEGCGQWYEASIPVVNQQTSFSDGAFIVGVDIQPGTYRSEALSGCYWERLSGLSRNFYKGRLYGQDTELIAKSRNSIVTIAPTDQGFISANCGRWQPQPLN